MHPYNRLTQFQSSHPHSEDAEGYHTLYKHMRAHILQIHKAHVVKMSISPNQQIIQHEIKNSAIINPVSVWENRFNE